MTAKCTAEHVLQIYQACEACQTQTCCTTNAHIQALCTCICFVSKGCCSCPNAMHSQQSMCLSVCKRLLQNIIQQSAAHMYHSNLPVSLCCHAELQLAAQQAEAEERAQAASDSDPQPPAQQPHTAPQQPGLTPKGTPHQAAAHEGPRAPSGTPKAATPRAAVGSHAHFAETPAADMGEQDRIGLGQHHLKMPL